MIPAKRFSLAHPSADFSANVSHSRALWLHPQKMRVTKSSSPRFWRFVVKGRPKIIADLNKMLKNELTAINQYFLHARMMKHWGFELLGKKIYEESIGEMKHADTLMQRILMLDGLPNLQDLGRLMIGETVPECLKADLTLESTARDDVVAAIALFEIEKDYVSREIAVRILEDAEEHIDFLETELGLLEKVGLQNYLQTQIGEGKEP
jgi:bacterioferritin